MTLSELVIEASKRSPDFKRRIDYWLLTKQKSPDLTWLMGELETILGKSYVRDAAISRLKTMEKETDGTSSEIPEHS